MKPEPGSPEYEKMIDFMRADLEANMAYSKIIEAAKKSIEGRGGDFMKEFDNWKRSQK
jgi:hypothetical protein